MKRSKKAVWRERFRRDCAPLFCFWEVFLQGQGRHTLQGPAAAGSESGRRTCIRGQWSFWEPRSSRRTAPFGQRQIIRKEPCSAFRKRVSGRRKMRFFLLSERKVQQGWSIVRGSRKWFISAGFLRPWERRLPARGRSRLPFTEGGERDCCPAAGIVFRVTGSRQGRIF